MKCPICGKEEFIKLNSEILITQGDQHLTFGGQVCANCGHIEFNGYGFVNKYLTAKKQIELLENEIKQLENKKKIVSKSQSTVSKLEVKIGTLYAEISNKPHSEEEKENLRQKVASYEETREKEIEKYENISIYQLESDIQTKKENIIKYQRVIEYFL